MRAYTRVLATFAAVIAGTALVIGQTQGYRITVSQDRLINAANEPQNWLVMNGDYGSTRYSRLAQINRDKVIANLPDGRVIAINRDNGEIVWDKRVAGKNEFGGQEEFFTAPLVAEGIVIVQNGAGDGGTRGWVAGLDAKTGDE